MKIKINKILDKIGQFNVGEHTVVIISMAVVVGILSGFANVLFRAAIHYVHEVVFVNGSDLLNINKGGFYRILIPILPVCGALLLIPISMIFKDDVNGYGFPKFLERVNIKGGRLKRRTIPLRIISSALTIGTGGSAGVEGPIAQIGGAIGSLVGQFFKVSGNRIKLLIAAGAAGGIAATFNAPIAGVMFATEIVLLGNYELTSFAAIVISAGMATVVSRIYYGGNPIFTVPAYELNAYEIPLYIIFGIFMGVVAVLYIKTFYKIKDRFEDLKIPKQLKPVLGAFLVGSIGIFFPQIMGDGYQIIEKALDGNIIFIIMFALIFLKIIATSLTLGSGGAGGVFAPSLFIGAMAGGAFGWVVHTMFPAYTSNPGAYATVGVGAFLAAATHAPLTAIFLLFEMTGNYKIIVPIMFASILGTLTAKHLYHDSIDTVELTRKGYNMHDGREATVLSTIKVKEVMKKEFTTLHEDMDIHELLRNVVDGESFYFPVVDNDNLLTGIVSLQDIKSVLFEEDLKGFIKVKYVLSQNVIVLKENDNLNTAIERFAVKDIEELPVVDIFNERKIVGMLKRGDVISAYNRELIKRRF
ncbi:MAG TPA: chloride channel protein [Nitrospirae bacterium]|nr:H(+)/Cl(-) exchange transporter ClcA [bacterium BMS3Abin09]GBE41268.1 H(+)/Cl(-) exchange transporter ClcA [bacterium BMS3Bbin09]HDH33904.1 chloride channel protein [Nitrospirota bacterium]HDZ84513.1 chloride channel protein [Nitrospirota bacterium]